MAAAIVIDGRMPKLAWFCSPVFRAMTSFWLLALFCLGHFSSGT